MAHRMNDNRGCSIRNLISQIRPTSFTIDMTVDSQVRFEPAITGSRKQHPPDTAPNASAATAASLRMIFLSIVSIEYKDRKFSYLCGLYKR